MVLQVLLPCGSLILLPLQETPAGAACAAGLWVRAAVQGGGRGICAPARPGGREGSAAVLGRGRNCLRAAAKRHVRSPAFPFSHLLRLSSFKAVSGHLTPRAFSSVPSCDMMDRNEMLSQWTHPSQPSRMRDRRQLRKRRPG